MGLDIRPSRFAVLSEGGAVAGAAGGFCNGRGGDEGPGGISIVGCPFFDLNPITVANVLNFFVCLFERTDFSL